jgi:hypothetical protein
MREAKIIAKIENMEGLVNYREIMEQCDVMLLSRGSMGNCVDPEKMFLAQKMLLRVSELPRGGGWLWVVLGSAAAVGNVLHVCPAVVPARSPPQAGLCGCSCWVATELSVQLHYLCRMYSLCRQLSCHCCFLAVQECNLAGKPIYVTRVVDTMTDAPRPTRAEATGVKGHQDVYNRILACASTATVLHQARELLHMTATHLVMPIHR